MDMWVVFYLLATMNNAAVNICVQIFCGHMFSVFLVMYPEMELVGYTVTMFNHLRNCQTVLLFWKMLTLGEIE